MSQELGTCDMDSTPHIHFTAQELRMRGETETLPCVNWRPVPPSALEPPHVCDSQGPGPSCSVCHLMNPCGGDVPYWDPMRATAELKAVPAQTPDNQMQTDASQANYSPHKKGCALYGTVVQCTCGPAGKVTAEMVANVRELVALRHKYHTEHMLEKPEADRVDELIQAIAEAIEKQREPQEPQLLLVFFRMVRDTLPNHWLTSVECNHAAKTDCAHCFCGWNGHAQPSVGDAVVEWSNHVTEILGAAGDSAAGTRSLAVEAIALLNSMVRGGESHSTQSEEIVRRALVALESAPGEGK